MDIIFTVELRGLAVNIASPLFSVPTVLEYILEAIQQFSSPSYKAGFLREICGGNIENFLSKSSFHLGELFLRSVFVLLC